MRILHTSDWHIGKRIAGKERLDEQRVVLDEIADICEEEKIELVLVAGDVFDTYLPSAEAEDLFYHAVKKIAGQERCVLIISGNHDDAVRLTAAAVIAEEQGIYIYGEPGHVPAVFSERKACAAEASDRHIVFKSNNEEVFVNVLPYPNETRLKEDGRNGETYFDTLKRWIDEGESRNSRALPSIFLSHLFVAGGRVSEGEREIDLGGARAVPLCLLPKNDYIALGHLHRKQHFKNTVYYSGSILQYAFDEANTEKSVVLFDIGTDGVKNIRERPLQEGKKLVRVVASNVPDAIALLQKYPESYIELTIYLNEPLIPSQVQELKKANDGLVAILPIVRGDEKQAETAVSRKNKSSSELFKEYYSSLYGESPSDQLCELFLSLTEDADEAETP